MILSPHIITGAALGANFQSADWRIYLLPIVAIILHHSLDRIPHYDYNLKPFSSLVAFKVFLDISVGTSTVALIYLFFNTDIDIFNTAIGAFFGTLPDGILLLSFIFPEKWLLKYQRFHASLHFHSKEINPQTGIETKKTINFIGLFTQVTAVAISLYFLI